MDAPKTLNSCVLSFETRKNYVSTIREILSAPDGVRRKNKKNLLIRLNMRLNKSNISLLVWSENHIAKQPNLINIDFDSKISLQMKLITRRVWFQWKWTPAKIDGTILIENTNSFHVLEFGWKWIICMPSFVYIE